MSRLAGWFLQVPNCPCQRLGIDPARPLVTLSVGPWLADDQWPQPGPRSFITTVDEELINSRSKTEMENFIRANLRIITQETVLQKALRTVLPMRGQGTVIKCLRQRVIRQMTCY